MTKSIPIQRNRLFQGFWLALALIAISLTCGAEEKKEGGPAADWWNKEFAIRKKITINTTAEGANITDPMGKAAVLVRLYDGNFQFAAAQEDASDIRFVAADGKTVLPHRIEKYDSMLNEAYVWVGIPEIKPNGPTDFWLYYGNAAPEAGAKEAAGDLFEADTQLVYHFSDNGGPPGDSTKNLNNAENAAVAAEGALIGGGLRLIGQPVKIPATESLRWNADGELTWSAWVKPAVLQATAVIFSRKEGGNAFVIGIDNGVPYALIGSKRTPAGAPLVTAEWAHLAVTVKGGNATFFVNGIQYGAVSASLPALNSPMALGGDPTDSSVTGFSGEMDELNISNLAKPAGAIKLAAISQGKDSTKLLVFGEDEQGEGAHGGGHGENHFAIIIANLTLDGWIVIYILLAMSAVSWWVMIGKVLYLNSAAKGNDLFMKAWENVAADLTELDHGDQASAASLGGRVRKKDQKAVSRSPIYRVYHVGSEEIRHRLNKNTFTGDGELSSRSIQAIRATLDGKVVRESARLNSGIVLLTIAISGGPFLGLLGTVVGVMITFAAVAAAGDVNVNAIAPGIAAALLATVAGLAVAIPAMFGYNYLLTRIGGVKNDMHVFIDEFVTKMAEFYGDSPAMTRSFTRPRPDAPSGLEIDRGQPPVTGIPEDAPRKIDGAAPTEPGQKAPIQFSKQR